METAPSWLTEHAAARTHTQIYSRGGGIGVPSLSPFKPVGNPRATPGHLCPSSPSTQAQAGAVNQSCDTPGKTQQSRKPARE